MTSNEIKESGLLELYVLGILEGEELTQVEQYLTQYPALKIELKDIETTLQKFALLNAVAPSAGLKASILSEIQNNNPKATEGPKPQESTQQTPKSGSRGFLNFLVAALALLSMVFGYLWLQESQNNARLQQAYDVQAENCDSLQQVSELRALAYQSITNPEVNLVQLGKQAKYPTTQLYLYTNPVDKKNYLKLNDLPEIDNATQSFQLWSLKGDNPPVPLDVFQSDDPELLEVRFVDETETYAITIEEKGGKDSPNLANLIGTFSI
ncbi:MAG: anti-sigma factor [Saprospiraceae bacterium]